MAARYYEGVGCRKESTARVRVSEGSGLFTVNGKEMEEFFTRMGDAEAILDVLEAYGRNRSAFDITVQVKGGGVTGQTDAVVLGLARSLVKYDPECVSVLRKGGFMTRDPRVKERKKPGLKRARKAPTYTKR